MSVSLSSAILRVITNELSCYEVDRDPLEQGAIAAVHARVMIEIEEHNASDYGRLSLPISEASWRRKLNAKRDHRTGSNTLCRCKSHLDCPLQASCAGCSWTELKAYGREKGWQP